MPRYERRRPDLQTRRPVHSNSRTTKTNRVAVPGEGNWIINASTAYYASLIHRIVSEPTLPHVGRRQVKFDFLSHADAVFSHHPAILQPKDADERFWPDHILFAKRLVLPSVTLNVEKSAANECPAISRPAEVHGMF